MTIAKFREHLSSLSVYPALKRNSKRHTFQQLRVCADQHNLRVHVKIIRPGHIHETETVIVKHSEWLPFSRLASQIRLGRISKRRKRSEIYWWSEYSENKEVNF